MRCILPFDRILVEGDPTQGTMEDLFDYSNSGTKVEFYGVAIERFEVEIQIRLKE